MPHTLALQLRYADIDGLGHVNNARYATYAETGRLAYLREVGVDVSGLILARLELDFKRPVHFGDAASVESRVTRVGNTSFTMEHRVVVDGVLCCAVSSVVVCFDYAAEAPTRVPESIRALVE